MNFGSADETPENCNSNQSNENIDLNKREVLDHIVNTQENINTKKQNLPKRVLRDRKLKMPRSSDSMTKCHL
jgi:hypothetical protein